MAILLDFANEPGDPGAPPARWPDDSRLPRQRHLPTLVMVAHPRCPCTRASLEELNRILAHDSDKLVADVVFIQPPGAAGDWSATDVVRAARAIPGVHVLIDAEETEARRFGARTSGQTLLYDAGGRLRFRGGITAARGHAGDNAGRSAIQALLEQGAVDQAHTSVFGCALEER